MMEHTEVGSTQQKIRNHGIGSNIIRLRKQQGLKPGQVVAKMQSYGANISRTSYSKLEAGKRHITPEELIVLTHIFKANLEEFFLDIKIDGQNKVLPPY